MGVTLIIGLICWSVSPALAANAFFFGPPVNYEAGSGARFVATGDFNQDGKTDLAVVNNWGDSISILLNNGDGTFAPAVNYSVGIVPHTLTVGDFNADGKADLAVTVGGVEEHHVSILLGNGNGTFAPANNYNAGPSPLSLTSGEFNNDGKTDIAVTDFISGDVSILLGSGDGNFSGPVNYHVGSQPFSITTGDFNADGKTDFAVANAGNSSVSILFGNGDGTFAPSKNFSVGSGPKSVTTGDFNADGRIDLGVANEYSDNVSILLGDGDGSFTPAVNYSVGNDRGNPKAITTGDFNGDGKTDLVVANEDAPGHVSILLGNGDGTFAQALKYGTEEYPGGVAAGDFNGDDKTDLAATNYNYQNVEILMNSSSCTPFKPTLLLSKGNVFWESYYDYVARQLSVNYSIYNSVGYPAYNLAVIGSPATNGVICSTIMPFPFGYGFLYGGLSYGPIPVKYSVPQGVSVFIARTYATAQDACGNTYDYPEPYPSVP